MSISTMYEYYVVERYSNRDSHCYYIGGPFSYDAALNYMNENNLDSKRYEVVTIRKEVTVM